MRPGSAAAMLAMLASNLSDGFVPPASTGGGPVPPRGGRSASGGGRWVSGAPQCTASWEDVHAAALSALYLARDGDRLVRKRAQSLVAALKRGKKSQVAECIRSLSAALDRGAAPAGGEA